MWDIVSDSWEGPYGRVVMLEIASISFDELELEKDIVGNAGEIVGRRTHFGSKNVGDEDDGEDVIPG